MRTVELCRSERSYPCNPKDGRPSCGADIPVDRVYCPQCRQLSRRPVAPEPGPGARIITARQFDPVRLVDAATGAPLALLDVVSGWAAGYVARQAQAFAARNVKGRPRMSGLGDRQAMFGTLAPQPVRQRYGCTRSQVARDTNPADWASVAEECHGRLSDGFPDIAARNIATADSVADCWKFPGTGWTSGVLNLTQVLAYHRDAGNLAGSWSAMIGARSAVTGGDLYLPEYDTYLSVGNRSLLCFPGAEVTHGVTPITVGRGGWRVTAVFYGLRMCRECADSYDAELLRSQARATVGNRAVAAGTSTSYGKVQYERRRSAYQPPQEPPVKTEAERLDDLVAFARIEQTSADLEPWALILAQLRDDCELTDDEALWLIKLYNAYDSLGSAWAVFNRWATPAVWAAALDRDEAAKYECTQERRNLLGGRVLRHLDHYTRMVAAQGGQARWLSKALHTGRPRADWLVMCHRVRDVWGTGRQSAFEWAEFLAKVMGWPLEAPNAMLWESEGPRRSIQRLYGMNPDAVTMTDLDVAAVKCKQYLTDRGVMLPWEDFETVICDFNVARDGRYYPGRHLAALREEIEQADDNGPLLMAWAAVIPEPWRAIAPGIDKAKMTVYRDTGTWITEP